jgi:hypothetical protein
MHASLSFLAFGSLAALAIAYAAFDSLAPLASISLF